MEMHILKLTLNPKLNKAFTFCHIFVPQDPFLISNETDYEPYTRGLQQDVYIKWPLGVNPDLEEFKTDVLLGWVNTNDLIVSYGFSLRSIVIITIQRRFSQAEKKIRFWATKFSHNPLNISRVVRRKIVKLYVTYLDV